MPIAAERRRFTTWQIAGAPASAGVYALWQGEEVIYIGCTRGEATIRSQLQEHYARRSEPHDATHFAFELLVAPQAPRREAELLDEFVRAHARMPRGNVARR